MKMKVTFGIIVTIFLICMISGCFFMSKNQKKAPTIKLSYSKDLAIKPEAFWSDSELKKVFFHYWSLKYDKKTEELFKLEAPYFQIMANFDRYSGLVESVEGQVSEIELRDRVYVTDRLIRIQCVLRLKGKDGDKSIPMLDQWVYAGEKWYHVWRDPLIFPHES